MSEIISKLLPPLPDCSEELKQKLLEKINDKTTAYGHFCSGSIQRGRDNTYIERIEVSKLYLGTEEDIVIRADIFFHCNACNTSWEVPVFTDRPAEDAEKNDKLLSGILAKQFKILERTELLREVGRVNKWRIVIDIKDKFRQGENTGLLLQGEMLSNVDPEEWIGIRERISLIDLRNKVVTAYDGKRYTLGVPQSKFFDLLKSQDCYDFKEDLAGDPGTIMGVLERQEKILANK